MRRELLCDVALIVLVLALPASKAGVPAPLAAQGCRDATEPQVALDEAGDAIALWRCSNGTNSIVQAAERPAATGIWGAPQGIPGASQGAPFISEVALALDAAGDAAAVWVRYGLGPGAKHVVQAATRPAASGTWSPPQDLFVSSQGIQSPQVALDAAGNAVAVWQVPVAIVGFCPACPGIVQAAMRPAASGVWSPPQDISAPGRYASAPRVAVDPAGNAVVVWQSVFFADWVVQAAVRPVASGVWSPPQDISAVCRCTAAAQVALDGVGEALAIWPAFGGGNWTVQTTERPAATGIWSAPQDLPGTNGREVLQLALALNTAGDAVAIWRRGSENNPPAVVQASVRSDADKTWSAPRTLSGVNRLAGMPAISLDAAGDAVAVWQEPVYTSPFICPTERCTFPPPTVRAAVRPAATGTWSASHSWRAGGPQVAVDPAGDAVALWVVYDRHNIVQAAVRPAASAAWSEPQYVSAPAPPCLVPRLTGKTLAKAKAALKKDDCSTGSVSHAYSQKVKKGRVLGQRPKVGTKLKHGASVSLVLSRGRRRR